MTQHSLLLGQHRHPDHDKQLNGMLYDGDHYVWNQVYNELITHSVIICEDGLINLVADKNADVSISVKSIYGDLKLMSWVMYISTVAARLTKCNPIDSFIWFIDVCGLETDLWTDIYHYEPEESNFISWFCNKFSKGAIVWTSDFVPNSTVKMYTLNDQIALLFTNSKALKTSIYNNSRFVSSEKRDFWETIYWSKQR